MFSDLKFHLKHILEITGLGTLKELTSESYYAVFMPVFTEETVKSLWVRIIFDLSTKGLVKGILEVPMAQINNQLAIIWVKKTAIVCCSRIDQIYNFDMQEAVAQLPALPSSICLAIGGPSGVGKTTLIERLQTSQIGSRVKRYIAYTTRPKRPHEVDGVDYRFVDTAEIDSYRKNPRFTNFIEARGYWYWNDPVSFFESRWRDLNYIHVFAITQTHEFIERRQTIPDLLWVWLNVSDVELRRRLEKRGDLDVERSIIQNLKLMRQDRTGLISLELVMETGSIDIQLRKLLELISNAERR